MAFDPKVQIMYEIKRGKESESEKESWGGELSTKLTAGSLTISYHTLPCALRCSFLKGGGGVPASLGREGRGRRGGRSSMLTPTAAAILANYHPNSHDALSLLPDAFASIPCSYLQWQSYFK